MNMLYKQNMACAFVLLFSLPHQARAMDLNKTLAGAGALGAVTAAYLFCNNGTAGLQKNITERFDGALAAHFRTQENNNADRLPHQNSERRQQPPEEQKNENASRFASLKSYVPGFLKPFGTTNQGRVQAIRNRLGNGRVGNAAVALHGRAHRHYFLSNALYYPALAAAAFGLYKAARYASETIAEWVNDPKIFDQLFVKINELTQDDNSGSLQHAVQEDEKLAQDIAKLSDENQKAINEGIAQFDRAICLDDPIQKTEGIARALELLQNACDS